MESRAVLHGPSKKCRQFPGLPGSDCHAEDSRHHGTDNAEKCGIGAREVESTDGCLGTEPADSELLGNHGQPVDIPISVVGKVLCC